MHCRDALIAIFLFCLSLFTHLTSSLRFHGSCANFAGRGDVADDLATAARNAKQVADNAWDMLDSLDPRYMSRPERDRINRILGAYAIGAGKRYYGRTIDGLIEFLKIIGRVNLDASPLTIYCGSSNPALFRRVAATFPNGTASFQYITYITDPPSYLQIGFGLCQDVSELRAFTEFKSRGGRFMVFCPAAFEDAPLTDFPMTNARRNVDFSTIGEPGDHINDYALSLTGVFLHELHHSLCDATFDVPLRPPLTTRSGNVYLLAYAYYGTTELAYQVSSRSANSEWFEHYELIPSNADSVSIIAIAIWLRGSGWHRGYARAYTGMPSQRSSKRSLPSLPDRVDETYSLLPQRQDVDDDLLEPAISTTPSSSQVTFMGGPRHKSQGIDATWFGLTIPPGVGLKQEWVKNEWMNPIPKRMGLTRRRYGKGLAERNFVA